MLLGFDIGTSSVKASLVDASTGQTVAQAQYPDNEAPISAPQPEWAEQDPEMWWDELLHATARLKHQAPDALTRVRAVGISYQMHGLVCVDKELHSLRPAIIWCDGRAVPYGQEAFDAIGHEQCLSHLLNSPGNFTAAKLAWVKDNEPETYSRIYKIMLPGDYIAMRLSEGTVATTISGLSEGMFWDFKNNKVSDDMMHYFGFAPQMLPNIVDTFSVQGRVSQAVAQQLGIPADCPISYRGGDQPNNALSLNVMRPGEIAATGGTSGVVYGVTDQVNYDPLSRVNTFAHVNHLAESPRLGILLCVNGTGIMNAWMRRTVAPEGFSYPQINELAEEAPIGAEGLSIIPFGNGAERVLENQNPGASVHGINFNVHTKAHMLRAAQEGIAFSFVYGIEIMQQMGLQINTIKAPRANLFLSPLFRRTLATVTGASIKLYKTDGSVGAALGAGLGAGIYADADEAFHTLQVVGEETPQADAEPYRQAYARWREQLGK